MNVTNEELQQTINKLVFENSSYALSEISLLKSSKKLNHLVAEIIKETYCGDNCETTQDNNVSFIIAHSKILDIVKNRPKNLQFPLFLTLQERENARNTFTFVEAFLDWKFNYKEFYKALCTGQYLPLELLWSLHERGIMPFEMFFSSILENPKAVAAFSRGIVNLCTMEIPVESASSAVISGILVYVITSAFPNMDDKESTSKSGITKISSIILDCMLKRIITCERMSSVKLRKLSCNLLWENPATVESSLHAFCSYALKFIVSYNPNIKVSQALSEQQNWTFRTGNSDFVSFIQKVLMELKPQEVSTTLRRALEAQEINWKSLLIVTSTYLVCFKEASSYLINIIDELLEEAFQELESDHLFSGFLLARQAALEGPPVFPFTYGDWFQKTFGDASSTRANNPCTFGFLMKFLTDLVPHEHIQYLKVHVERPPYIVNRCRSIFTDYSSLVKTRLQDLEPISSSGIFSSADSGRGSSTQSSKAQLAAEIEKVLSSFETTGKIPSAVLEASIFRKPYFSGQFLPALLASRLLPDVPDTKMKFIDALKRMGKIPSGLYEQYEKACCKEAEKMFEGITLDDSFEDFLNPEEQLHELLKNLQQQLETYKTSSKDSQLLLGTLTENCKKLNDVLKQLIEPCSEIDSIIMLTENTAHDTRKEMVQKILDTYCNLLGTVRNMDYSIILAWDVVLILAPFPSLHGAFYLTIWDKLCNSNKNYEELEEHELYGLCLCILRTGVMNFQYPPVMSNSSHPEPVLFPEAIFDFFPVTKGREIQHFLSLASLYLEQATWCSDHCKSDGSSSVVPNYIPRIFLKKFQFAAFRLVPEVISCDISSLQDGALKTSVLKLYESNTVKEWINAHQLSLTEWLTFESEVVAEADHFDYHERLDFHRWCINCHFMAHPELIQDSTQSVYRACASNLFRVLMSISYSKQSFLQLLMILQEHVSSLSCDSAVSRSNTNPWLLQEFDIALNAGKQEEIPPDKISASTLRDIVQRYIKIACSLPPLLLVADSFYDAQMNPDFKPLENVINNFLKLYACENGFLTPMLTNHILKALLEILQASNNELEIENFFLNCPLVLCSLIIHWKIVQPIIASLKMKKRNYFGQMLLEIGAFISWSDSCISKKETSSPPTHTVLYEWAPGLILACRLQNSKSFLIPLHSLNYQLCTWALQFFIALETACSITQPALCPSSSAISFVKAFMTLHKNENGLDPRVYSQSVLEKILPPVVWQNFPANVLRILMAAFPKEEVPEMSEDLLLPLLSSLLMNLAECNKCCDIQSSNSVDQNNGEIPEVKNQVLTIDFLLDSSQKLKEFITLVPSSVIKILPRAVLHYCGEEMQLFLYQKVRKRTRLD